MINTREAMAPWRGVRIMCEFDWVGARMLARRFKRCGADDPWNGVVDMDVTFVIERADCVPACGDKNSILFRDTCVSECTKFEELHHVRWWLYALIGHRAT
jgi:hypothetical protein